MANGRIDIHNHLLPGIDDGCRDIDETLACIRRLQEVGYSGAVCTPHVVPPEFPDNTPDNIQAWTEGLREVLREAGIDFEVWPGGELRLYPGVAAWMSEHGVPALGPSKCVLCDYWESSWPDAVLTDLQWMIDEGYRPILAHPERLPIPDDGDLEGRLDDLAAMGVWLQGNFNSLTGLEGAMAGHLVRNWLRAGRYQFMALDLHRLDSMESRLDGVSLGISEFGAATVERLTGAAPRELILRA